MLFLRSGVRDKGHLRTFQFGSWSKVPRLCLFSFLPLQRAKSPSALGHRHSGAAVSGTVTLSCFTWGSRRFLGLQRRFWPSRWAGQGPLPWVAALQLTPPPGEVPSETRPPAPPRGRLGGGASSGLGAPKERGLLGTM